MNYLLRGKLVTKIIAVFLVAAFGLSFSLDFQVAAASLDPSNVGDFFGNRNGYLIGSYRTNIPPSFLDTLYGASSVRDGNVKLYFWNRTLDSWFDASVPGQPEIAGAGLAELMEVLTKRDYLAINELPDGVGGGTEPSTYHVEAVASPDTKWDGVRWIIPWGIEGDAKLEFEGGWEASTKTSDLLFFSGNIGDAELTVALDGLSVEVLEEGEPFVASLLVTRVAGKGKALLGDDTTIILIEKEGPDSMSLADLKAALLKKLDAEIAKLKLDKDDYTADSWGKYEEAVEAIKTEIGTLPDEAAALAYDVKAKLDDAVKLLKEVGDPAEANDLLALIEDYLEGKEKGTDGELFGGVLLLPVGTKGSEDDKFKDYPFLPEILAYLAEIAGIPVDDDTSKLGKIVVAITDTIDICIAIDNNGYGEPTNDEDGYLKGTITVQLNGVVSTDEYEADFAWNIAEDESFEGVQFAFTFEGEAIKPSAIVVKDSEGEEVDVEDDGSYLLEDGEEYTITFTVGDDEYVGTYEASDDDIGTVVTVVVTLVEDESFEGVQFAFTFEGEAIKPSAIVVKDSEGEEVDVEDDGSYLLDEGEEYTITFTVGDDEYVGTYEASDDDIGTVVTVPVTLVD